MTFNKQELLSPLQTNKDIFLQKEKEEEELNAIYNTAKMQDEEFKKDEEQQILQNQQKPSFLNKFTNVAEKQLEVFSAWQERENGLIGKINEAVENYVFPDDPDKEEPDFNIDNFINERIKNTEYEPYANTFYNIKNRLSAQNRLLKIDEELNNKRILEEASLWYTIPSAFLGTITNPIYAANVNFAGAGLGSALSRVGIASGLAGITEIGNETLLQQTQLTRSRKESEFNVLFSMGIGGIFQGIVEGFKGIKSSKKAQEVYNHVKEQFKNVHDELFDNQLKKNNVKIENDVVAPKSLSAAVSPQIITISEEINEIFNNSDEVFRSFQNKYADIINSGDDQLIRDSFEKFKTEISATKPIVENKTLQKILSPFSKAFNKISIEGRTRNLMVPETQEFYEFLFPTASIKNKDLQGIARSNSIQAKKEILKSEINVDVEKLYQQNLDYQKANFGNETKLSTKEFIEKLSRIARNNQNSTDLQTFTQNKIKNDFYRLPTNKLTTNDKSFLDTLSKDYSNFINTKNIKEEDLSFTNFEEFLLKEEEQTIKEAKETKKNQNNQNRKNYNTQKRDIEKNSTTIEQKLLGNRLIDDEFKYAKKKIEEEYQKKLKTIQDKIQYKKFNVRNIKKKMYSTPEEYQDYLQNLSEEQIEYIQKNNIDTNLNQSEDLEPILIDYANLKNANISEKQKPYFQSALQITQNIFNKWGKISKETGLLESEVFNYFPTFWKTAEIKKNSIVFKEKLKEQYNKAFPKFIKEDLIEIKQLENEVFKKIGAKEDVNKVLFKQAEKGTKQGSMRILSTDRLVINRKELDSAIAKFEENYNFKYETNENITINTIIKTITKNADELIENNIKQKIDNIYDAIVGNSRNDLSDTKDFIKITKRGSFKERSLTWVDYDEMEEFLENNTFKVIEQYSRIASADNAVYSEFGTLDVTNRTKNLKLNKVLEAYEQKEIKLKDDLENQLIAQELNDKEKEKLQTLYQKQINKLQDERKQFENDFTSYVDFFRGITKDDYNDLLTKSSLLMRNYQYLTKMGSAVVSQLGDTATVVLNYGFKSFLKNFPNLLATLPSKKFQLEGLKLNEEEMKLAGFCMQLTLNNMMGGVSNTFTRNGDAFFSNNPLKNVIDEGVKFMNKVNFMSKADDSIKNWTGLIIQEQAIKAIKNFENLKNGSQDLINLNKNGIGKNNYKIIKEQLDKHSYTKKGFGTNIYIPNTQSWDNKEAVNLYRTFLNNSVNSVTLNPKIQDMPIWGNKEFGKLILQFKGFTLSSINKILIPALQKKDTDVLAFLITSFAMANIIMYAKNTLKGKKNPEKTNQIVKETLKQTSFTPLFFDINQVTSSLGIDLYDTEDEREKRVDPKNFLISLGGPSVSSLADFGTAVSSTAKDGSLTPYEQQAIKKLIPYQNLFYVDRLFNTMITKEQKDY